MKIDPPGIDSHMVRTLSPCAIAVLVSLGSFILILSTIGVASVQRTQEARVLECAREMVGGGWRAWMIPHANGIVRLQKPPLAYWLSAASFEIFGVSTWAGRLPLALAGWLLVMLVYQIARQIAGIRAGIISAALFTGSFLFYRYARVAETDVLMTLMLTLSMYAIWRGFEIDPQSDARSLFTFSSPAARWFQISGIAIGLCGLSKGLPAWFAIAFLVGAAALTRQWRSGLRWLISGAPVLALLIAGPWWIYARSLPQGDVINHEVNVLLEGRDHAGPLYEYIPVLLTGMLPWTAFALIALVQSAIGIRRRFEQWMWLWLLAIALPLCFIKNRQDHYLVPLMPPLALLTGIWLSDATRVRKFLGPLLLGMIGVLAVGALALPSIARRERGEIISMDLIVAAALFVIAIVAARIHFHRSIEHSVTSFAITSALVMTLLMGVWAPTLQTYTPSQIAARLRAFGGNSYCFYGSNFSLPLIFELRTVVQQAPDAAMLARLSQERGGGLIVIAQTKDVRPPPMPRGFVLVDAFQAKDQKFEIYRVRH